MHTRTVRIFGALAALAAGVAQAQQTLAPAHDLGVRAGSVGAGQPLAGLSADELAFFENGQLRFDQADSVDGSIAGEPGLGLGPTFNATSCGACPGSACS